MKRVAQMGLIFGLLPAVALAHGQQVLGLPLGQGAALIVTIVGLSFLRMRAGRRVASLVAAIAAIVATWLVPNVGDFIASNFGYGMTPWFILGFFLPLLTAALAYALFRRPRATSNEKRA